MTSPTLMLALFAGALTLSAAASAAPEGDHMMGDHKMSPKAMQAMHRCEAMPHEKAMKNKKCAAMMKDHMAPGAMDHKM